MSKVLIIGGGHAGANVAFALRKDGFDGEIDLVSTEKYLPYHRPPLSKDFLKKKIDLEKLLFKSASFLEEQNIKIHLGCSIDAIDLESKLASSDDAQFAFDYLVFATGASPRKLSMPNADASNLFYLRSVDDVLNIHNQLDGIKHIALIGGGYIGLEVASAMRELKISVTVLEAEDRILKRVTGAEMSSFYQEIHESHGVTIRCDALVEELVAKEGIIEAIKLNSGELIEVDAVLAGIGAIPNIDLAEQAGITCKNGIVTDEFCRTNNPFVLAAGDCANSHNTLLNQSIRLESVPNALAQSKVIASSILGNEQVNSDFPWFWSDQYDLKLQMAGLSLGHDSTFVYGDLAAAEFIMCYGKDGYLIAVDSVNYSKKFMLFKKALSNGFRLEMEIIKNPNFEPESIFSGSN